MQSIYQHSMWSRLSEDGAPAVMLPAQVAYLSAHDALQWIASNAPQRLLEAIWTLVRGIPPATLQRPNSPLRHALLAHFDLDSYLDRRKHFSVAAAMFAAALAAYAQGDESFDDLRAAFTTAAKAGGFADAVRSSNGLAGAAPDDFLADLPDPNEPGAAAHVTEWLRNLEHDVHGGLFAFVSTFADAVAFKNIWEGHPGRESTTTAVFPVATYAVQHAASLTTTVTVTALVQSESFPALCAAIDPQAWPCCSDVFASTRYVDDHLQTLPWPPLGSALPAGVPHVLEEVVNLRWGVDDQEVGWFRNLLNVSFDVIDTPGDERAELYFSLNRAVESRVLWDQRPGGIVLDQGFTRIRRLRDGLWRMTARKALRFSDRATGNATGGAGFGELMSYITPATLAWWVESEMYSGGCPKLVDLMQASAGGTT